METSDESWPKKILTKEAPQADKANRLGGSDEYRATKKAPGMRYDSAPKRDKDTPRKRDRERPEKAERWLWQKNPRQVKLTKCCLRTRKSSVTGIPKKMEAQKTHLALK